MTIKKSPPLVAGIFGYYIYAFYYLFYSTYFIYFFHSYSFMSCAARSGTSVVMMSTPNSII